MDRLSPGEAYNIVEMLKAVIERKSAEIYAAEIAADDALDLNAEEDLPF